jgi:hypothetical protein
MSRSKLLMYKKNNPSPQLKVILVAGLVAGTLDILAAFVQTYINTRKGPDIVLKYIASGVFGRKEAFGGGDSMILWGLLFHFIIAFAFAAFFVLLYLNWKLISRHIILSGFLYGLFVWTVMNRLVVPMSKIPSQPFVWNRAIIAMLILVFFIGMPIALITKKYNPRRMVQ